MYDFLFEVIGEDSNICGEQFFVECNTLASAREIAKENFPYEELSYCGKYSVEEAEILGLDTY